MARSEISSFDFFPNSKVNAQNPNKIIIMLVLLSFWIIQVSSMNWNKKFLNIFKPSKPVDL